MFTTPQQLVDNYETRNFDKEVLTLPHHIERAYHQLEYKNETTNSLQITDHEHLEAIQNIKSELSRSSGIRSLRRQAERMLADYVEESILPTVTSPADHNEYTKIASGLRNCRLSGVVGIKPCGNQIAVWDQKCGLLRLCPDESREESQRIATKYIPPINHWLNSGLYRRAYYCVFTQPNFSAGSLADGKKEIYKQFTRFLKRKENKNIRGALVVQEDPLSANGDWNVHLNVILLVQGSFDYKQVRREWGSNVDLNRLSGTTNELIKTFQELIKYSSAPILEKSFDKAADRSSKAPSILNWTPVQFKEWWRSQKGFRRTRSYGVLNKQTKAGKELITRFESDIKLNLDDVVWIATVYMNGNDYEIKHRKLNVDLIQGYKSSFNPSLAGAPATRDLGYLYEPPPEYDFPDYFNPPTN